MFILWHVSCVYCDIWHVKSWVFCNIWHLVWIVTCVYCDMWHHVYNFTHVMCIILHMCHVCIVTCEIMGILWHMSGQVHNVIVTYVMCALIVTCVYWHLTPCVYCNMWHHVYNVTFSGSLLSHGGGGVTGVETLHTSSGGGAVGVSPPHPSNGLHPLHYAQAMGDTQVTPEATLWWSHWWTFVQGQGLSFIPAMSALGSSGMGSPPEEGTRWDERAL